MAAQEVQGALEEVAEAGKLGRPLIPRQVRDLIQRTSTCRLSRCSAILSICVFVYSTSTSGEMDCPEHRAVHPSDRGRVIEIPEVGGLHHHYERIAV
jgi:hypothetical protein